VVTRRRYSDIRHLVLWVGHPFSCGSDIPSTPQGGLCPIKVRGSEAPQASIPTKLRNPAEQCWLCPPLTRTNYTGYLSGSGIWGVPDFTSSVLISNFCLGARSTSVLKVWYSGRLMVILRWPGATIRLLAIPPNSAAWPT
jgi:hypothetical protein